MVVAVRWIGTLLIVAGSLLLAATAVVYGYSLFEEHQVRREIEAARVARLSEVAASVPTAIHAVTTPVTTAAATAHSPGARPTAIAPADGAPVANPPGLVPSPDERREALARSTPTAVPPRPPIHIVIESIGVDSPVVEAPLVNHEWQVPKFVVGHLEGSAYPGQGSNVALSGHVESISSGNVFAKLGEVKIGDRVTVATENTEIDYVVDEVKVVANTDLSVVSPTDHERLTLITCTGTWNPVSRDYEQRLIVVAVRAEGTPGDSQSEAGTSLTAQ